MVFDRPGRGLTCEGGAVVGKGRGLGQEPSTFTKLVEFSSELEGT